MADTDLRTRLAQAFSKAATANGRRLGGLRFALADAALEAFDADAQQRHVDELMEATRIRSMQIRDGGFEMDIDAARELTTEYVAAARAMLGDAENYSETPVEFTVGLAGQPERYVLIVQRAGKLTPHQARRAAEAERDELRARVEAVIERLYEKGRQGPTAAREGAFDEAALMLAKAIAEGLDPAEAPGDTD